MTSPNGTSYFLHATSAQGLANYPHARTVPPSPSIRTIYVSGTSSRRGDGSYAGVSTSQSGALILDIREQTAAVLENIGIIIKGATDGKGGLENVVDATVFLTDIKKDYAVRSYLGVCVSNFYFSSAVEGIVLSFLDVMLEERTHKVLS